MVCGCAKVVFTLLGVYSKISGTSWPEHTICCIVVKEVKSTVALVCWLPLTFGSASHEHWFMHFQSTQFQFEGTAEKALSHVWYSGEKIEQPPITENHYFSGANPQGNFKLGKPFCMWRVHRPDPKSIYLIIPYNIITWGKLENSDRGMKSQ